MAEFGVLNIWTYVVGIIFIVLLPGPNSLYVLTVGAGRSVRAGWSALAGVFVGDSILMALTAAGAASVLRELPVAFMLLKTVGAFYLGYLGLRLIISARNLGARAQRAAPAALVATRSVFGKALLLSLLNPKQIMFLLSFFVQFVDPGFAHPALSFLILALILQFFSVLYLAALIYGGARLAERMRRSPRVARLGSGLTGVVFLLFAGRMASDA